MKNSSAGAIRLRNILLAITILAGVNLLGTLSLVSLLGSVSLWVLCWCVHRGDGRYGKILAGFLFVYAAVNLGVLILSLVFQTGAPPSALIWLGGYSAALMVLGLLLRSRMVREQLAATESKGHHLFHGGWRDL